MKTLHLHPYRVPEEVAGTVVTGKMEELNVSRYQEVAGFQTLPWITIASSEGTRGNAHWIIPSPDLIMKVYCGRLAKNARKRE